MTLLVGFACPVLSSYMIETELAESLTISPHPIRSPHLGIPALQRLPRLPPQHRLAPLLPRLRQTPQIAHHVQTHLADARILLLADNRPALPRRPVRTPLLHPQPRQPPRVGDALAQRVASAEGSHGGGWGLVCADWGTEYRASFVAVCEFGGEEGEEGDELGGRGVGGYGP